MANCQCATDVGQRTGDAALHRNGAGDGLACLTPDAQVSRPKVDYARLLTLGHDLLVALGEDPERPGIVETPRRWANWWREFVEYDTGKLDTVFESVTVDQMVAVSGIRVWSLCEHHLLPFWCDLTIGYIAGEHVLGLSKFARVAHKYAHKLQIQERLVQEIADDIQRLTGSPDVAVSAAGEHLCMTMRGIKTPALMRSSVMRGAFRNDGRARAEFFAIAK